jgi:hypothetical protein
MLPAHTNAGNSLDMMKLPSNPTGIGPNMMKVVGGTNHVGVSPDMMKVVGGTNNVGISPDMMKLVPNVPMIPAANNIVSALQAVPAPNIPMIPAAGTLPAIAPITNHNQSVAASNIPMTPTLGSLPAIAPIINPSHPVQLHLTIPTQQPVIPDILSYNASPSNNLSNVGKRWSKDEESVVVRSLMQGSNINNIANNIGRTSRSVKMRILQILNNKFMAEGVYDGLRTSEGWSAEETCQRYQVSYNELLEYKAQASQQGQSYRQNNNNSTANFGQLPTIPQSPQLGAPVVHDPILTEIRDLLLAMNRKLDSLTNGTQ